MLSINNENHESMGKTSRVLREFKPQKINAIKKRAGSHDNETTGW